MGLADTEAARAEPAGHRASPKDWVGGPRKGTSVVEFNAINFAYISFCLALGALVQSAIGFGMGIVAIPLLVSGGAPLPIAMSLLMPNVLIQTMVSCWRLREHLPWSESWQVVIWRLVSLPLGVFLLKIASAQGQSATRFLLGIGLIGLLLAPGETGKDQASRKSPGLGWTCAAGLASGLLMGLIGMGGPPLMAWVMRQDWPPQRQRAFLWLSFLLALPAQIGWMAWQFGAPWLRGFLVGCCSIPLVVLVTWSIGTWADQWPKQRLRWGMRIFLFVLALRLVFFPGSS